MPKKTKKEKLLAQQRRSKLVSVETYHTPKIDTPPPQNIRFSISPPSQTNASAPKAVTATGAYDRVKKDLAKTLILTALILSSEILLARLLLNN